MHKGGGHGVKGRRWKGRQDSIKVMEVDEETQGEAQKWRAWQKRSHEGDGGSTKVQQVAQTWRKWIKSES